MNREGVCIFSNLVLSVYRPRSVIPLLFNLPEWFSNFSEHQNVLESLLKGTLLGPTYKVSDSVSTRCGSRTCISNKFLDIADAAGSANFLWESFLYLILYCEMSRYPWTKWVHVSAPIFRLFGFPGDILVSVSLIYYCIIDHPKIKHLKKSKLIFLNESIIQLDVSVDLGWLSSSPAGLNHAAGVNRLEIG